MLEGGDKMTTLRQLRISRGLQQKFISESCGINNNQLVRYEAGENKPCLRHAVKIAEFYGIETLEQLKKLFEI